MTTSFAIYYLDSKSYEQALQVQKRQGLDFIRLYKVEQAKTFVDRIGYSL